MKVETIKTVGRFEVVRITDRQAASSLLLSEATYRALPDEIGVRVRGAGDDYASIQGPFATLEEAAASARAQTEAQ